MSRLVRTDFDSVPVIDFAGMLTGDPAAKADVAANLRDACSNVGFFYIRNHGIPQALMDRMFAQSERFFRIPAADKKAIHVKKSPHLVGYVGMGEENADPTVLLDLTTALDRLAPEGAGWRHDTEGPDDMPAHVRSMLTATSLQIPVLKRELALGTWQAIYLIEHRRRPHAREIVLQFTGSTA